MPLAKLLCSAQFTYTHTHIFIYIDTRLLHTCLYIQYLQLGKTPVALFLKYC
ncbi:hypothetical protein RchiOBHm_Chr6g0263831 [Rosa chinensis]|uniref:Uncharacterized protein n=1 Tax=Rosa chinensis TaxID=74649 RepID=A0A2P6PP20_ROSCH|nr:hypothetical protein RchiOBHm_Chr6g0263831 [Rosa chinensis]